MQHVVQAVHVAGEILELTAERHQPVRGLDETLHQRLEREQHAHRHDAVHDAAAAEPDHDRGVHTRQEGRNGRQVQGHGPEVVLGGRHARLVAGPGAEELRLGARRLQRLEALQAHHRGTDQLSPLLQQPHAGIAPATRRQPQHHQVEDGDPIPRSVSTTSSWNISAAKTPTSRRLTRLVASSRRGVWRPCC